MAFSEQLTVRLLMDATRYNSEARRAATATGDIERAAGKAGTATGGLNRNMGALATTARVAVAGAATAAMFKFSRGAISEASALNESINGVNKTFKDLAPEIHAIGDVSAQSFGLSTSEFNKFSVRFSNLARQIADQSGRNVVDVIEEITGRTADFASVMDLDVPDAAQKFQSAMAGMAKPLDPFGIDVRDAAVQAKALELGISDGTRALTQSEKVLVRYRIIMDETASSAGDFKDTQSDLANASRTLDAEVSDVQASLGESLTPTLESLITAARPVVASVGLLADGFSDLQTQLDKLAESENATIAFFAELQKGSFQGSLPFLIQNMERLLDVLEGSGKDVDKFTGSLAKQVTETERAATAARNLEQAERDLTAAYREAADPIFAAQSAMRRYREAQQRLIEVQEDADATAADIAEAQLEVARTALEADAALRGLADGGVQQGIQAIAAALNLGEQEVKELLNQLDLLDGKVVSFRVEQYGSTDPSLTPSFGGYRHAGGPVDPNRFYVVGENGPELFQPHTTGQILSNQVTNQVTSGGNTIQVATVNAGRRLAREIGSELAWHDRTPGV